MYVRLHYIHCWSGGAQPPSTYPNELWNDVQLHSKPPLFADVSTMCVKRLIHYTGTKCLGFSLRNASRIVSDFANIKRDSWKNFFLAHTKRDTFFSSFRRSQRGRERMKKKMIRRKQNQNKKLNDKRDWSHENTIHIEFSAELSKNVCLRSSKKKCQQRCFMLQLSSIIVHFVADTLNSRWHSRDFDIYPGAGHLTNSFTIHIHFFLIMIVKYFHKFLLKYL